MGDTIRVVFRNNPGTWLFHCHVNVHLVAGMQAFHTVEPAVVAGTTD